MSQDPLGYDGGDTNLYRYCGNSVTNTIDPTGATATMNGTRIDRTRTHLAFGLWWHYFWGGTSVSAVSTPPNPNANGGHAEILKVETNKLNTTVTGMESSGGGEGKVLGPLRAGATNRTKILTGSWGAVPRGRTGCNRRRGEPRHLKHSFVPGVGGFRLGVELTNPAGTGVAAKLSGSWRNGVKADGPLFGLGFYCGSGKD